MPLRHKESRLQASDPEAHYGACFLSCWPLTFPLLFSTENAFLHELHLCLSVCAVQSQEEAMMSRIRDAEYAQTVAEMKQRIADLEIQVRSQPSLIMSLLYSRFCLLSIMCLQLSDTNSFADIAAGL